MSKKKQAPAQTAKTAPRAHRKPKAASAPAVEPALVAEAEAAPEPVEAPQEELARAPEGATTVSVGEEDFLSEVNSVMQMIRAALSVLPEPESGEAAVVRMQALYFGFLNTTAQIGLDLEVSPERMIEDMAECMVRADQVRMSAAEFAEHEAQQQEAYGGVP